MWVTSWSRHYHTPLTLDYFIIISVVSIHCLRKYLTVLLSGK